MQKAPLALQKQVSEDIPQSKNAENAESAWERLGPLQDRKTQKPSK